VRRDTRNDLRAAYDAKAEMRDEREIARWKLDFRTAVLERLRSERCTRLLEIGAGPGSDAAFFAGQEIDVVCVDLSSEMIRLCRAKGLEAYEMDANDLRFPDGSFDAAYSLNALLHLTHAEWPRVLREARRVLRDGGLFFLTVYGGFDHEGVWQEDRYEPKRFFSFQSDERLVATAKTAFELVSFERMELENDDPKLHVQSLILRVPQHVSATR